MTPDDHDEDYFVPLEDQRVFGAGISRKRVQFVRSSDHELNTTRTSSAPVPETPSGNTIANRYLSIVLPKSDATEANAQNNIPPLNNGNENNTAVPVHSAPPSPSVIDPTQRCEVCNLPLENEDSISGSTATQQDSSTTPSTANTPRPHEASLAHQVCLSHSHPPSHLDRSRHGLRYLSAYGWNPDSRLGLGAPGREGIREPLKGRLKVDTVGLGAAVETGKGEGSRPPPAAAKVQKLNAKEVRRQHAEAKKRGEKMREMFHRSDDVLRYLGEGA